LECRLNHLADQPQIAGHISSLRIGLEVSIDKHWQFEYEHSHRHEFPKLENMIGTVTQRIADGLYDEGPRLLASIVNKLPKLDSIPLVRNIRPKNGEKEFMKNIFGDDVPTRDPQDWEVHHLEFFIRAAGLADRRLRPRTIILEDKKLKSGFFFDWRKVDASSREVLSEVRTFQMKSPVRFHEFHQMVPTLERMPKLEHLQLGKFECSAYLSFFPQLDHLRVLNLSRVELASVRSFCFRHRETLKQLTITHGNVCSTSLRRELSRFRDEVGGYLQQFMLRGRIIE